MVAGLPQPAPLPPGGCLQASARLPEGPRHHQTAQDPWGPLITVLTALRLPAALTGPLLASPAGGPRHPLQDKPHHKHLNGFLIHLSPPPLLIHSTPPLLAMALPSWSLLSADAEVFDPLTLNFLPGDDVHISMYSMVLVLWCMCMCACCSPVVQVCLADPLPSISPWSLYPPHKPLTRSVTTPTCCFYMKIRSAVVLPYSFQNAAWHMSCFYCMGVCVCRVCVCVVCVYGGGTNLPICRLGLI